MKFYGREQQLKQMGRLFAKSGLQAALVYGRRRVGKSELIKQCLWSQTANHCFPTGILPCDDEPLFGADTLVYDGKYYLIGEGHKEFLPDKAKDDDYYLLTLAAIACELSDAHLTQANVLPAVGLPPTWSGGQKAEFAACLGREETVRFCLAELVEILQV